MALFSLKRIAGEAENRQTYLRGVACYNAGKVGRVVRDRDDFYEEYLSADVENNTRDGVFHVEVGFGRQGDADFYDCGCEAYRQGTGACQHIVAVMVHKYYADMLTGLSAPPSAREKERLATRTDETARRMMNRYLSRQAVDLVAHSAAGRSRSCSLPSCVSGSGRLSSALPLDAGGPMCSRTSASSART